MVVFRGLSSASVLGVGEGLLVLELSSDRLRGACSHSLSFVLGALYETWVGSTRVL